MGYECYAIEWPPLTKRLFLGKVDIVKDIIVNLAKDIASINSGTKQIDDGWTTLAVERFLEKDENASTRSVCLEWSINGIKI